MVNPLINPPRIVSAAMLMDDGTIVPGVRHFSPDMRAILSRMYGRGLRLFGRWLIKPYHLRVKEQGFIDAKGRFLNREEAWRVAGLHRQIFLYDPGDSGRLIPWTGSAGDGCLFSENLY